MAAPQWQQFTGTLIRNRKRKRAAFLKRIYAARSYRVPAAALPAPTQPHYRRAADTIIEEPNGNMLWANGIDPMLRFTPYAALIENAGIVPPGQAITMTGTGNGQIVGTFTAYSRFVDRDGNYSSLSPISNVYTPAVTVGTVTGVTNASPMVVTFSGTVTFSPGQIVKISGVMGCTAANNIWTVSAPTSTTIALVNADGTNSLANGVYNSGGTIQTGVSQIVYYNVALSSEAKVARRQVLRNQDGENSVYYIDIDTTDLTSQTLYSNTTSQSLSGPVVLLDTSGNSLVDKSVPPNWKKFIAQQAGRVFAAGIEPYAEGAVFLTNGSNIVTGIGTEWGQITFPGRIFTVAGGNASYTIQSVQSQTQLKLTTNYGGSTDPYAYYQIYPNGPFPTTNLNTERRTIYWSAPGQPEAWPQINFETLEEDPGAGEFTGLMAFNQFLFVLAQNRIYQFSWVNDPALDGFSTQAAQRGCINNRCWVKTEGAAWMLDIRGIHIFAGNDDVPIGTNEVQDLFRPQQQGPYKINFAASRHFHAVFDPGECIMRWFVTIGGAYTPRHAIAYQVRLRRWWLEEYPFPVGASVLGRLAGKPQVFLGSDNKRIFALGKSTLDGLDPLSGTVSGTVTSVGTTWIADSTASFPPANLVGNPCYITQGIGKGQRRTIVSVSGNTLNMDQPWTTQPSAVTPNASQYQIGGVKWKWKSGWRQWAPATNAAKRAIHLTFNPVGTQQAAGMKVYNDFAAAPAAWSAPGTLSDANGIALLNNDPTTDLTIDATKANGYVWQRLDNFREMYTDAPRFMAVELNGVSNQDSFQIRSIRLDGVQ